MERKLYYNGTILTMDEACPRPYCVLTEGGLVAALGSAADAERYLRDGARPVDLQGRLLLPGFIDSHLHLLSAALNRLRLDISGMPFDTVGDMLAYVRKETEGSDTPWISVVGFSETNMGDGKMVTRDAIDAVFPHLPVTIIRVCGHMSIINSQAIDRLDGDKMASIQGGEFRTDAQGRYTGLATEGAQQYVLDTMPAADVDTALDYLVREQELLLRCGITAIHDAGTDMLPPRAYVEIFQELERRGQMKLRTSLMVRPQEGEPVADFEAYLRQLKARHTEPGGRLHIGAVKLFADGSLGSRTAAVNAPYQGEHDNLGLLLEDRPRQYVEALAAAGHQLAIHAIGDRATAYVASLYAACEHGAGLRLRVEHAELLDDALMDTLHRAGILVMTQPVFIHEFGSTYFRNLGQERAMQIQPLRTMLSKGLVVGFGTDYPVDDPSPLLGIQAAMTRQIKDSGQPLNKGECISFADAVRCYTLNSAYGAFWEDVMGSVTVGKYADFAILSGFTCDRDGAVCDVSAAAVEETIIGGQTVYRRG